MKLQLGIAAFCLGLGSATLSAYGQKPSVMVVPSDRYLIAGGYGRSIQTADGSVRVPDYQAAFQGDPNLRTVIAAISSAFQDSGYPIRDMEQTIKGGQFTAGEMAASDRQLSISPRDRLLMAARSDVVLDVDMLVERVLGESSVSFTINALDSYSNRSIATVTNTGQPGAGTPLSVLFREAVIQNMPIFEERLRRHFDDLGQNGRVARIEVAVADVSPIDLEEWIPYDGDEEELGVIIKNMIRRSAMNGQYHLDTQTRSIQVYDEVRVPLFDGEGLPMDVDSWARDVLARTIRRELRLDIRVESNGLGHARLVVVGRRD